MKKSVELALSPLQAFGEKNFKKYISRSLRIQKDEITAFRIIKRSVDSRHKNIVVRHVIDVYLHEEIPDMPIVRHYQDVRHKARVVIAGAGPAGLFAALRLIEQGHQPVILERGKEVSQRKADIAKLNTRHIVNPESNYCFGEGGAGTFSDGKLYTRSTKRGDVNYILETLVYHGANPDILIDAHPHLGTDKLPGIIGNIRNTILEAGGQMHFGIRITDLATAHGRMVAFIDQHGNRHEGIAFILATGHSARDVFELCASKGLCPEPKSFAVGVRVEHPQELIDTIQYHGRGRGQWLPAAAYSLVHQVERRGVFSFCMCPGGIMVPSASGEEQVVMNGMSNSRRNSPYANSGIVVAVNMEDLAPFGASGPLAGLRFQEQLEKLSFRAGGSCQHAPAQRLTDFINDRISDSLPKSSYHPGLESYPLGLIFPDFITRRLKEGFKAFDNKMKGFLTQEAVITAVESRTSSPLRIPRLPEERSHPAIRNLYPCGEGSGYAGGIVSSAIDGINTAGRIADTLA